MTFLVRLTMIVLLHPLLLLLLLFPKVARTHELLSSISEEHVPFVIDVCKLYRTNSTIFLYAKTIKEIEMVTMVFEWTRALSREGFTTSNMYFYELQESSYYIDHFVRPHYVAIISNQNAYNEFSLATSKFDMSYATWLVIFTYEEHGYDHCHDPPGNAFHLRFDSEMLVRCGKENILREWYSIDPNRTEIDDFATWSVEGGIVKMVRDSLYERRYDLKGLRMRAVVVKNSALVKVNEDGKLSGFFGNISMELCGVLNFTLDVVSEQEVYGSWNPKEKAWSGAIGEIYAGRADISISDFSVTNARLNVVDFTIPILLSKSNVYFRKSHVFAINWSSYFLTFTTSLWIATCGIFVFAMILITYLKIKAGTDRRMGHILADNILDIWGIFCQQGLAEFSNRSSLRIAYLSISLLGVVLSAAYSAALISFLTSAIVVLPFRSLEGIVADGTYKFSVFRGGSDYDMFANSEQQLSKDLMKLMLKEEELPVDVFEGFRMICENRKLAIYSSNEIEYTVDLIIPCEIVSFETGYVDSLAIILSKRNPYTKVINVHLQKFIKNGMISRLRGIKPERKNYDMMKPREIQITSVITPIFFVTTGIILSTCILIVEKCVFVYKSTKDTRVKRVPLKRSLDFYANRKNGIKNIANVDHANCKGARVK